MKRRTIKALSILFILALAFIPWNAFSAEEETPPGEGTKAAEIDTAADEDRPELSADVGFLSQYIWRGLRAERRQPRHSTLDHGGL